MALLLASSMRALRQHARVTSVFASASARYGSSAVTSTDFSAGRIAMVSEVPGPKSKAQIQAFLEQYNNPSPLLAVDYPASKGNYMVDADGNTLLDCFVLEVATNRLFLLGQATLGHFLSVTTTLPWPRLHDRTDGLWRRRTGQLLGCCRLPTTPSLWTGRCCPLRRPVSTTYRR
eukprot:m.173603 g.173603  ORF g.173603 m.173603 type:complete len:175 (+) comp17872_c0_seq7:1465-1989(+)